MIDPKAFVAVAAVFSGAAVSCTALFVWSRWLLRPRVAETNSVDQDARMRRLEGIIESMAGELERLGDNQQFTAKLLMERPVLDQAAIERAARENVPLIMPPTPYRPQQTPH